MSGLETYGPTQPPEGPQEPAEGPQELEQVFGPGIGAKVARSKALLDGMNEAIAGGHTALADVYRHEQEREAVIGQINVEQAGLPLSSVAPNAAYTNQMTEVQRLAYLSIEEQGRFHEVLQGADWNGTVDFLNEGIKQYREKNASRYEINTTGFDPQQLFIHQQQMEPLQMDPMVIAEQRQKLAQIDAKMKEINPEWSVFTHPETEKTAKWIARESSLGGGFMESGEVDGTPSGVVNEAAQTTQEAAEGFQHFPLELVYGAMDLVGIKPPTNYIEGPDGEILTNEGKSPGIVEIGIALKARLMGEDVVRALARYGTLKEAERQGLSDLQKVTRGSAAVLGMAPSFGKVAGTAMGTGQAVAINIATAVKAGEFAAGAGKVVGKIKQTAAAAYEAAKTPEKYIELTQKGLRAFGHAIVKERRGIPTDPRASKMIRIMAGGTGAAVGEGLAEGLAFGRRDGYMKAFEGGAMMGPILLAFGSMGRSAESFLRRNKIPRRISMVTSGLMEGAGFAGMEQIQHASMWEFMKDPTEETWMAYAKSMIGFGLFKGLAGHSAVDVQFMPESVAEAVATSRRVIRGKVAKKISEVEEELHGPPKGSSPKEDWRKDEIETQRREDQSEWERDRAIQKRVKEREDDPRGFHKQALKRLEKDEEAFKSARGKGSPDLHKIKDRLAKSRRRVALEEELAGRREVYNDDPDAEGTMGSKEAIKEAIQEMDNPESPWSSHKKALQDVGIEKGIFDPYTKEELDQIQVTSGKKYDFKRGDKFYRFEDWGDLDDPTAPVRSGRTSAQRARVADDAIADRTPTAEEAGKELERLRIEDEAEDRAIAESEFIGPRPSAGESLRIEIRRLRQEGPSAANRKRIIELLNEQRGKLTEAVGDTHRQLGEMIPTEPWARKKGPPVEGKHRELEDILEDQAKLEKAVKDQGVPYAKMQELGDQMRVFSKDATPEELFDAQERIHVIEQELDVAEISGDPDLNAKMRREVLTERLNNANVEPGRGTPEQAQEVRSAYGERTGPDSMRRGANPYRQHEDIRGTEGSTVGAQEQTMISRIFQIMGGKQGRRGVLNPFSAFGNLTVKIPFTDKRLKLLPSLGKRRFGETEGSEVQIAIHSGHMGQQGALGLFEPGENLVKNAQANDLDVGLHEWSHAMQRQMHLKAGGGAFWPAVASWHKSLPAAAKAEYGKILENYPGWEQLPKRAQAAEVWAEWHARNLSGQGEVLDELYPNISREIRAWMGDPQVQPFIKGQYRDIMHAVQVWNDMGSRRRMGATIRRKSNEAKPYDYRPVDKLVEQVVKMAFDDKIELKRSQERWLKRSTIDPRDLPILSDPSRMIDTVSMTASKEAQSFLKNGPHDLAWRKIHGVKSFTDILTEAMGPIRKPVEGETKAQVTEARRLKLIDFVDYIYGTRALEKFEEHRLLMSKNRKARPFKMPLPEMDYLVGTKEIIDANPEFAGLSENLKSWSDSLLDLIVEAAQLTPGEAAAIKATNTVYLPFVRQIEGGVGRFAPGRGVAEGGTGTKAMKSGSREEIMDPVRAMEDVTRSMIVKARKAMVMHSLYRLARVADVGGLVTIIPKANVAKEYRVDQIVRNMESDIRSRLRKENLTPEFERELEEQFGIFKELLTNNPELDLSDTLITLFAQKDLPFGEKDPIIAYTPPGGKMVWLKVDPPAFEALMGIDNPLSRITMDLPLLKPIVRKPAQMLRLMATDASAPFALANLIRDISSTSLYSREGKFQPLAGLRLVTQGASMQLRYGTHEWFQKLIEKAIKDPDPTRRAVFEQYIASGASTSSFYNEGVATAMRGEANTMFRKSMNALDAWKRFWSSPEGWIRIGEYERIFRDPVNVITKGELERGYESLEGAREITVNFARAGDVARAWNQMTPYFTATLAGQRKLVRTVLGMEGRNDEERASRQKAAMANGLVSITIPTVAVWMMTKDEDWYQDLPQWRKTHFLNFKLPGARDIISLPLPFEAGVIFGSAVTTMLEALTGGNPNDLMPMLKGALFPYFENQSSWVPQFIKPIAEIGFGYDLFRDQPITPERTKESRVPGEQMRPDTSKIMQGIWNASPSLGFGPDNPIELEHLASGYTAGFTQGLTRAMDQIFGLKEHTGLSGGNPFGPFVNRFVRQTQHGSSRTVNDFYEEKRRLTQIEPKNRTPEEKDRLKRLNQVKEELDTLKAQDLPRREYDRRKFEITNEAMQKVNQ